MFSNSESTSNVTTTNSQTGQVVKKFTGIYYVQTETEQVMCSASSRLRKNLMYSPADLSSVKHKSVQAVKDIGEVDPIAIGDYVRFVDAGNGEGQIQEVLPRRSRLSRPDVGDKPLEHVIVANLDQMVVVFAAARPEPRWNLLDRYIAAAESLDLDTLIVITKMDIGDRDEIDEVMDVYRNLGYRVVLTASETGEGLNLLRDELTGKLSAFVGKSGVGKSSLLNALEPGLHVKTGSVSHGKTGKGKQTTTHMEMYPLGFGGHIVDTPGIRVFGIWELDGSDIALAFREMRPFVGQCGFGLSCTHEHEPRCLIRAAVENGEIHPRRYESYLRILHGKLE